jgi:DNA-binding IscR family transcriptional regulator
MVSRGQSAQVVVMDRRVKVTGDYVASYISWYWKRNRYGPSVRDIADEFNVSTSTVHRHLMSLVNDGILEVNQGRARTWRAAF